MTPGLAGGRRIRCAPVTVRKSFEPRRHGRLLSRALILQSFAQYITKASQLTPTLTQSPFGERRGCQAVAVGTSFHGSLNPQSTASTEPPLVNPSRISRREGAVGLARTGNVEGAAGATAPRRTRSGVISRSVHHSGKQALPLDDTQSTPPRHRVLVVA
jgi:hypothetical protein